MFDSRATAPLLTGIQPGVGGLDVVGGPLGCLRLILVAVCKDIEEVLSDASRLWLV